MSRKIALLAICLGYFMTILDTTVVNVALHSIQLSLHASVSDVQWIVVGYTLTFASLLLSGGTLGERFGNRRMYIIGLLCFTAASLLCGLAPNLLLLQLARVIQGAGAALLVPVTLGLISELFTTARENAKAVGLWGGLGGVAAAGGPIIGGFLVGSLGWRSIFLLNIPVGILAVWLSSRFLSDSRKQSTSRLDIPGQIASIIALGSIVFALLEAEALGPISLPIISVSLLGIVTLVIFIAIERWSSHPMIPLSFFRNRSFSAANLVGFLINFATYGWLFVISLYFQQVRHFSPFFTGIAILPWGIAIFISAILGGRATAAYGARKTMLIGLGVGVLSLIAQISIHISAPFTWLILPFSAFGFGMAFTMPAMTVAVISHAPRERAGISSGIVNAGRQVGSSLGVALLGGFLVLFRFLPGLQLGIVIAAVAFSLAYICTMTSVYDVPQEEQTNR